MTKFEDMTQSTALTIDRAVADAQPSNHRPHLGGSVIGRECWRELYYIFNWCTDIKHGGQLLRLFRRGQHEETFFYEDLRAIGVTVYDVDPSNGNQWRIADVDGHFGGSLDGIIKDLPESPAKPHVLECKTHNDKSFKLLLKDGVEKSKFEHFTQMQVYMFKSGIDRALYTAVNKNNDELYTERVKLKKSVAKEHIKKAKSIIYAEKPPVKLNDDASFFKCKFCDHSAVCHKGAMPALNCRTCVFSSPVADGQWFCDNHFRHITDEEQRQACGHHLYKPVLMPDAYELIDVDAVDHSIEYRVKATGEVIKNVEDIGRGQNAYPSKELQHLDPLLAGDKNLEVLREGFGGTITSDEVPF